MTFDIVLTTYDSVVSDNGKEGKCCAGLDSYKWHRIVLDEGKSKH